MDFVVNKIIICFKGRVKETTTIPTKPIPIGFKFQAVAQRGFLILQNQYIPAKKNGPVGVKTPRELDRIIKAGNGENKTQAIVLYLIKQLPSLLKGYSYHVFLDNLFVSTRFVKYACSQGVRVTSTCQDIGGINKDLLKLKKEDKKDIVPWGETHSIPTPNSQVYYIG